MKKLLRIFMIELLGLYFADQIATGLVFQNEFEGMIITAAALGAASLLVRPMINLLLLPITLATLGLLKFLSHAVVLYLVDLALVQFSVEKFEFAGLTSTYLDLPPVSFQKGIFAYLAFSIVLSLITGLLNWIRK